MTAQRTLWTVLLTMAVACAAAAQSVEDVAAEIPAPPNAQDISDRLCTAPRFGGGFDMNVPDDLQRRYRNSSAPKVLAAWGRMHLAGGKTQAECPVVDSSLLVGRMNQLANQGNSQVWTVAGLQMLFDAEVRARERAQRVAKLTEQAAAANAQAQQLQAAAQEQDVQKAHKVSLARYTPQALYILGGKLEREGRDARAVDTYEYLIDKHTESPWAVKANDRLLQIKSNSDNAAAQQRASRQATCLASVPSCQERCGSFNNYSALQRCEQACLDRCQ